VRQRRQRRPARSLVQPQHQVLQLTR
jgi:hypothetical protein